MRKIIQAIGLLTLDISSAIVLTLGSILVSLPIVLHLIWGIDNDAYIEIGEWGGTQPNILSYFGLEPVFRIDFLLWPALFILVGLGLRVLLWVLFARQIITGLVLPAGPMCGVYSSCGFCRAVRLLREAMAGVAKQGGISKP